jgi:hypothetical protein
VGGSVLAGILIFALKKSGALKICKLLWNMKEHPFYA